MPNLSIVVPENIAQFLTASPELPDPIKRWQVIAVAQALSARCRKPNKWYRLSNTFLRIGHAKAVPILRWLGKHGLIEIYHSYTRGKRSKRYRLSSSGSCTIAVPHPEAHFLAKSAERYRKHFSKLSASADDPLLAVLHHDMKRLRLPCHLPSDLRSKRGRPVAGLAEAARFEPLRDVVLDHRINHGRIYTQAAFMPEDLRRELLWDGDMPIIHIDISKSQH